MPLTTKIFSSRLSSLWLPAFLVAPYLLYAIRGGIPSLLPSHLAMLYPLLVSATVILKDPRTRAALEKRRQFFLIAGCAAFFVAALSFGYAMNPGAEHPEAYNFHAEFLDVEQGGFFTHPTENRTEFAIHFSPVLLLIVPIFHFIPHPLTLFAVGSLMMTLAVPLAFRFLRARWCAPEAALIAFGAALYPSLLSVHGDFSPVRFAPAAIWLLLIAYRRMSPRQLALAILACWFVKETVLLAVIMIGVIALIERRNWKWAVFPASAGIGLFILTNNVLLPWFANTPQKTSTIAAQFGYWGSTAPAVILGFVKDPVSVATALFRLNNLAYFFKLAHPCLFILPFGSPLVLAALPELLVNTLAGYHPELHDPSRFGPWTSLVGHYSVTIGTVVWAAAAESFAPKAKDDSANADERWARASLLFLAVLSTVIYPTNAETL